MADVQNKRKEKARIAARARRSQEASIIMEMAEELHISQEKMRRIDKATIVKLAIDYIKSFEILCRFKSPISQSRSIISGSGSSSSSNSTSSGYSSNSCNSDDTFSLSQTCDYSAPKISTGSIFAPKTEDMNSHFLVIDETKDGRPALVLKPDELALDEEDLTHLAPQAGDISISLDVEPLDGIVLDIGLFYTGSPPTKKAPISIDTCKLSTQLIEVERGVENNKW